MLGPDVPFRHRNIRLNEHNYIGQRRYFVTICCDGRAPLFVTAARANWLLRHLRRYADEFGFAVHAYCVMPDHVHILAEGLQAGSHLMKFVEAFKQRTGYEYGTRTGGKFLWQKKYYDHILRFRSNADAVAWYIWMNPVRAGLCGSPREYPFSGSFTRAIEMLEPPDNWRPPWKKVVKNFRGGFR